MCAYFGQILRSVSSENCIHISDKSRVPQRAETSSTPFLFAPSRPIGACHKVSIRRRLLRNLENRRRLSLSSQASALAAIPRKDPKVEGSNPSPQTIHSNLLVFNSTACCDSHWW